MINSIRICLLDKLTPFHYFSQVKQNTQLGIVEYETQLHTNVKNFKRTEIEVYLRNFLSKSKLKKKICIMKLQITKC